MDWRKLVTPKISYIARIVLMFFIRYYFSCFAYLWNRLEIWLDPSSPSEQSYFYWMEQFPHTNFLNMWRRKSYPSCVHEIFWPGTFPGYRQPNKYCGPLLWSWQAGSLISTVMHDTCDLDLFPNLWPWPRPWPQWQQFVMSKHVFLPVDLWPTSGLSIPA